MGCADRFLQPIFGLLLATSSLVNPELNYSLVFLYYSGLFLSFPLSLLVYVALRFREIIREVRQNAKQVVQLSDEKKQQAINQQKILQEEVDRQTAELRSKLIIENPPNPSLSSRKNGVTGRINCRYCP
jgi:hypothetical protein